MRNLSLTRLMIVLSVGAVWMPHTAAQTVAEAEFAPKRIAASADFASTAQSTPHCAQETQKPTPCVPGRKKHRTHKKTLAAASAPTPATKIDITDPLAVHPEAAVKDTPAKEIILPGVMKIAGANSNALDFSRVRVIDATNDGSKSIYVSATDQNRIQVPWVNPKVIGTDQMEIEKSEKSNNIYVQFKEGVNRAVQIYIERPEGGGAVFGLQLIPKQIPAQTIILRDASTLAEESIKPPKSNDYVSQTQAVMETVALGGALSGYSQIALKLPPIIMNGLVVTPEKQFSAPDRDVYLYDVVNPAQAAATLTEQEFDGERVLAISIFPSPILRTNEHAKVIVIARKSKG